MSDWTLFDSRRVTARAYHRQAVEALQEQRLEDAMAALRHALEMNPHMDRAWNDLGVVMEALGNPKEAVRCYRQALEVQPDNPDAKSNLGLLMLQMNMVYTLRHQAVSAGA